MSDNADTQLSERQVETLYREMKYKRLYRLAYGYEPTQFHVDTSLEMYYNMGLDTILDLEEMINETDDLAEVCEFEDIPAWMMAAAPNPATYRRWLTTGRV
jgi:hypothetical protein